MLAMPAMLAMPTMLAMPAKLAMLARYAPEEARVPSCETWQFIASLKTPEARYI